MFTGTDFPFWSMLMLSAHHLPLESWAMCLCNEVDGTALAYVCAFQQCLCSKELRITVFRSWLCHCCSALNHCFTAVLAWICEEIEEMQLVEGSIVPLRVKLFTPLQNWKRNNCANILFITITWNTTENLDYCAWRRIRGWGKDLGKKIKK